MLKYYDYATTFAEFPDEIALCLNISNCPGHCPHCSEPWLLEDVGTELTEENIQALIDEHSDCTVFGLMGGDADHDDIIRIAKYVKTHSKMKVGLYSGENNIDMLLVPYLDFYKIGAWVCPEGDPAEWYKKSWGPLQFPFSNQLYFEIHGSRMINATNKFRRAPLSNLEQYIIK